MKWNAPTKKVKLGSVLLGLAFFIVGGNASPVAAAEDPIDFLVPAIKPKPSTNNNFKDKRRALFVDADGGNAAFQSLSKAIKAAGKGDIIFIKPKFDGSAYEESATLKITKPLELRRWDEPGETPSACSETNRERCIKIKVKSGKRCLESSGGGVVMSNIEWLPPASDTDPTQMGFRRAACIVVKGGSFKMATSIVHANSDSPAVLIESGVADISRSYVEGGSVGIQINKGEFHTISHTRIIKNVVGLQVNLGASAQLFENEIVRNYDKGVELFGGGGAFDHNDIGNNGGAGVLLWRQTDAPLTPDQLPSFNGNKFYRNKTAALVLWRGAKIGTFTGNLVCKNKAEVLDGTDNIYDPKKKKIKEYWPSQKGSGGRFFGSRDCPGE